MVFDRNDAYAIHAPKPEGSPANAAEATLHNSEQSLCKLPQELLSIIWEDLEIDELYYFAQTCRSIRAAVDQYLYRERGQHLLLWAASTGKRARAQWVFAHGNNININFKGSGRTALALAIENYTPDRTRLMESLRMEFIDFTGTAELLLNHPDIDLEDETNGIIMLKSALRKGFGLVVDRLLQHRQNAINAVFDDGHTPLTAAIWCGRTDILKLLIDLGADVNQRNGLGQTALAQAFESYNLDAAKSLSEQDKTDLTDETNGMPVLERAIEKGICPIVERLLQCCQDSQAYVNTPFCNGQKPLVTAARCGREEVLDLLIRSGANVNQLCESVIGLDSSASSSLAQYDFNRGVHWTALPMAARHGHEEIVRRLLRHQNIQTDLISTDFGGSENSGDAVFWAAVGRHYNCVLTLLRSPQVSYSAEQIDTLLDKVKSASGPVGDYSTIYELLEACQDTNSPESRQANLKCHLTPRARFVQQRASRSRLF
ncbi:Ankyrin repeat-containing domain protein [Akanthomyces lecanii RCEF 1005]|uniref:Ankyrin repeat-containing domain protein n=1 Tax=Akanthomyces lecanii RCEF 1005 TaxID=1081108 RepID=A0A167XLS5_CORDF|nr:Ankyrin repeat-containing domain protein [Akanthomyces lecanii RCEF 1005]